MERDCPVAGSETDQASICVRMKLKCQLLLGWDSMRDRFGRVRPRGAGFDGTIHRRYCTIKGKNGMQLGKW